MFKNYLTAAWRNLIRNKLFSIINIAGLAIGLAACFMIGNNRVSDHRYRFG